MSENGGGIRVLHVDDDPSFLEIVGTYLENEDEALDVLTAETGAEALEVLEAKPVDCVVSDYRMPEIDGLALLSAVRERHPEMPFVLYTGHGSEEIASEAISAGVTDYMQKETGTDQYTVLANTIRNAVDHQRTESALEESEERYRTLVEQSHDGIYIYRDDGFVFVNDRLCEITGYDRTELLETNIWTLLHEDDRDRIKAIADRRWNEDDAPSTYEARVVTADGETRHLEFSVQAITYDGERAGLGSVRDITDRHRQEGRLDEFASIVSHDLRNPLNVIAGRLDLAQETSDDTHFEAIERSVTKMEDLLVDMRELASMGTPVHETSVVDVAAAAREAWSRVEGEVSLTVADGLPSIDADADRLERLLFELFENAVVHGESQRVRVEPTGDGFAVIDDGNGIETGECDRVFEAGYTTETERTGFGLTFVDWIADAHGWEQTISESDEGGVRIAVQSVLTV